ncbi:MAG: helix-turn-helix transcriptional regulator [Spirochaetia bacterium]|nr:helix-turn-helix transcriptional regulator [Spirochaetia bacterium]
MFVFEDGAFFQQLELRLFQVGWVSQTRKEWDHRRVQSPFNRIYFVVGGDPVVGSAAATTRPQKEWKLETGRVYLIPLHRTFDYACGKRVEKFYAHFRLETALGRDAFEQLETPVDLGAFEVEKSKALLLALKRRGESDQLWIQSQILEALARAALPERRSLEREVLVRKNHEPLLSKIEADLSAELSVEALAASQGKKPAAFSAAFKRDFGTSVKRFLNERMTLRARDQLARTDQKVREVAAGLGFQDEFYFSRFFKKMTGRSPQEYRKSSRMQSK